jgi:hypothetical protein
MAYGSHQQKLTSILVQKSKLTSMALHFLISCYGLQQLNATVSEQDTTSLGR